MSILRMSIRPDGDMLVLKLFLSAVKLMDSCELQVICVALMGNSTLLSYQCMYVLSMLHYHKGFRPDMACLVSNAAL